MGLHGMVYLSPKWILNEVIWFEVLLAAVVVYPYVLLVVGSAVDWRGMYFEMNAGEPVELVAFAVGCVEAVAAGGKKKSYYQIEDLKRGILTNNVRLGYTYTYVICTSF